MPETVLSTLIDQLNALREERRELQEVDKKLRAEYQELEQQILEAMNRQGLDKATSSTATVSLSEIEMPSVTDWTRLSTWIKRNNAFYLFERRIAKGAWAETIANRKGRPIPGVETIHKTNINLRSR